MIKPLEFDYSAFYDVLLAAARDIFTHIQQEHKDEQFYAFAFYTEPFYAYLTVSANTEEGLTRRARQYMEADTNGWYSELSLDEMRLDLRHSPADWFYDDFAGDHALLAQASDLIRTGSRWRIQQQRDHPLTAALEETVWQLFEDYQARVRRVCFDVLLQLDREGVFGDFRQRNHVILNFVMGDQSDGERLAYARELNPADVVARYEQEVEAGVEIATRIHTRIRQLAQAKKAK